MNETPRRTERTEAAIRALIGRPAVYAPIPLLFAGTPAAPIVVTRPEWVRRALARSLPGKDLTR